MDRSIARSTWYNVKEIQVSTDLMRQSKMKIVEVQFKKTDRTKTSYSHESHRWFKNEQIKHKSEHLYMLQRRKESKSLIIW